MKQSPNWTEIQIEELKKLAGTMSCQEIGKIIGRSKDAVKNKIFSLDLPRYTSTVKKELGKAPKKKNVSPVVESERPPLIAVYKNHTPYKSPKISEVVSRLIWCQECGAPVSDVIEHGLRIGCKKIR